MATLRLEIVTPEAKTYSEEVDSVTLPAAEGEMGVFPNHVPLMAQVVAGEVLARKNGQNYFLAIGEGFVQITGDRVAIMTDMAIKAENIDEAKAEEARRRAEARLSENSTMKKPRTSPPRSRIRWRNLKLSADSIVRVSCHFPTPYLPPTCHFRTCILTSVDRPPVTPWGVPPRVPRSHLHLNP